MKSLHLDLVRVTEAGAITSSEWVGRGNKEKADEAATDAMRERLNSMSFSAEIVIGEGEKDESFGLFGGEIVGKLSPAINPNGHQYDIAVDPIEGTTPTAKGGYEAISVIAMGEKGSLFKSDHFYMDKLAYGPKVKKWLDETNAINNDLGLGEECVTPHLMLSLDALAKHVVGAVAAALGKDRSHVTVCVLDRPRTQPLIKELREVGCRIKFISDCDVTACIAACVPDSGVDLYWSIGGSPEAVIAACAIKCMGGDLQCREVNKDSWTPDGSVLSIKDLAKGDVMFAATGITDGKLLKGVRWTDRGPVTNSLAMRSESGTVRWLNTEHGN